MRKEAEEKLGKKLPGPDEPGFYALLEELREKDPELAALLEEGIEFEQVRPPEEEVRREVKKRAFLRDLYNRLFNRYDELTGEWVPSRPKQILIGVGGLMGLVVFMWALNNLGGPKRPAQAHPSPQVQQAATAPQAASGTPPQAQAQEAPAPPAGASGATGEAAPQSQSTATPVASPSGERLEAVPLRPRPRPPGRCLPRPRPWEAREPTPPRPRPCPRRGPPSPSTSVPPGRPRPPRPPWPSTWARPRRPPKSPPSPCP